MLQMRQSIIGLQRDVVRLLWYVAKHAHKYTRAHTTAMKVTNTYHNQFITSLDCVSVHTCMHAHVLPASTRAHIPTHTHTHPHTHTHSTHTAHTQNQMCSILHECAASTLLCVRACVLCIRILRATAQNPCAFWITITFSPQRRVLDFYYFFPF